MGRFFLVLLFSTFSFLAHGERSIQTGDSRFSFEGAQQAYKTAVAPTPINLVGEWMMVGQVYLNPSDPSGYYPDGRFTEPGMPGYFYWFWNYIEKGADSFGGRVWTLELRTIGAETGKLYYERSFNNIQLSSTGAKFFAPSTSGTCAATYECRIVEKVGMLLCEAVIDNSKRDCVYPTGTVAAYVGLVRKVVPAGP